MKKLEEKKIHIKRGSVYQRLNPKKVISTSKRHAKHPFAAQIHNIQEKEN